MGNIRVLCIFMSKTLKQPQSEGKLGYNIASRKLVFSIMSICMHTVKHTTKTKLKTEAHKNSKGSLVTNQ